MTVAQGRRLLLGGRVHTPAGSRATAMLTVNGSIAWIGDDAQARSLAEDADEIVPLDGALVTPAFVDAHVHLTSTGLSLAALDLSRCASAAELLAVVAAAAPSDGVVLGFGWDDSSWPGPPPPRAELDVACGGRPAYLSRVDVHSALASSAMLALVPEATALAGFDDSGPLTAEAHHAVREAALVRVTPAQRHAAQRAALERAARRGIACVHEMGGPTISSPEDLVEVLALGHRPDLPAVIGYWGELGAVERALSLGARGAAGDLFIDGSLGSRTACLRAPYADAPHSSGIAYLTEDEVAEHLIAATRAGCQAGFHVIGDAAADMAVAGLRRASAELGTEAVRSARHRLEHAEMLDPDHMRCLAELGVVASVQPAFDAAWGGTTGMYARRLGVPRALALNPFAALEEAGTPLALGSDSPVTELDPWGTVRAAAWHRTPQSRIDVAAAFAAHTRGGRLAAGEEKTEPGLLAPGLPATYAVWQVEGPGMQWAMPDLDPDMPLPVCVRTVRAGVDLYDAGEWR